MNDNNSDNWKENFTFNEARWKSLKTTYGYMVSQFKNPELTKCVIFLDKETSEGSSNGRTLLMSPAMVAAAAINGKVTDVRKLIHE